MPGAKKGFYSRKTTSEVFPARSGFQTSNKAKSNDSLNQFLPRLRSSTSPGSSCNFSFYATPSFIPEYMRRDNLNCSFATKLELQRQKGNCPPSQDVPSALFPMEQQCNGESHNNSSPIQNQLQKDWNFLPPRDDTSSHTSPDDPQKSGEHSNIQSKMPPKDSISLTDIMARLDALSSMPQKIDDMAHDLKQLKVIKDTMTRLGSDLSQVQTDVRHLHQTVLK